MSLKHIIKYMAVPVVAAFALVGCSHEDFTTAPKSSAEQTEKTTTKKRTIKMRLSADIELPKGTDGRGIEFSLDPVAIDTAHASIGRPSRTRSRHDSTSVRW